VSSAGLADTLDAVLSSKSVGIFKPDARLSMKLVRPKVSACTRSQVLFLYRPMAGMQRRQPALACTNSLGNRGGGRTEDPFAVKPVMCCRNLNGIPELAAYNGSFHHIRRAIALYFCRGRSGATDLCLAAIKRGPRRISTMSLRIWKTLR